MRFFRHGKPGNKVYFSRKSLFIFPPMGKNFPGSERLDRLPLGRTSLTTKSNVGH
jgi:hypothetical protein